MDFRHPSRSQQDRTRREDRHLNFYIARDKLDVGLSIELVKPLNRGGSGLAKIRVTKDRPGGLTRPYVADLALKSDPIDGAITWTIAPAGGNADSDEGHAWKPTWYMEQVSRALEAGGTMKRGEIVTSVGRQRPRVLEAINCLIIDGRVAETVGPHGAKLCTIVQKFRAVPGTTWELGTTNERNGNGVAVPSRSHLSIGNGYGNDWTGTTGEPS